MWTFRAFHALFRYALHVASNKQWDVSINAIGSVGSSGAKLPPSSINNLISVSFEVKRFQTVDIPDSYKVCLSLRNSSVLIISKPLQ